jgi:hypothetical protein
MNWKELFRPTSGKVFLAIALTYGSLPLFIEKLFTIATALSLSTIATALYLILLIPVCFAIMYSFSCILVKFINRVVILEDEGKQHGSKVDAIIRFFMVTRSKFIVFLVLFFVPFLFVASVSPLFGYPLAGHLSSIIILFYFCSFYFSPMPYSISNGLFLITDPLRSYFLVCLIFAIYKKIKHRPLELDRSRILIIAAFVAIFVLPGFIVQTGTTAGDSVRQSNAPKTSVYLPDSGEMESLGNIFSEVKYGGIDDAYAQRNTGYSEGLLTYSMRSYHEINATTGLTSKEGVTVSVQIYETSQNALNAFKDMSESYRNSVSDNFYDNITSSIIDGPEIMDDRLYFYSIPYTGVVVYKSLFVEGRLLITIETINIDELDYLVSIANIIEHKIDAAQKT